MKKNMICWLVMSLLWQGQITAQVKSSGLDSSRSENSDNMQADEIEKVLKLKFKSRFDAGDNAPDFTRKDVRGNPVSLKQFRGKYVVLQFWASWCKPCRASSGKLLHLYNQYHGSNFDMISISIDNDKDLWMNAIAEDRIYLWSNILDDIAGDSSVYRMFGLDAVPNYFLIDPDGKIVNRYITVNALQHELEEIFVTDGRE